MSELVKKSEVLDIWNNYWETTQSAREAEELLKDLEVVSYEEQPPLNDNQQIVLEQLCLIYIKQIYKSSLQAVYIFIKNGMSDAYLNLDRKEADQVLEVFAKWAQEMEEV
ncbi:hypothetical protein BBX37_08170 [Listeria monocytogenes]|nr:hypothetical protein [Listeria monocytogenes]